MSLGTDVDRQEIADVTAGENRGEAKEDGKGDAKRGENDGVRGHDQRRTDLEKSSSLIQDLRSA